MLLVFSILVTIVIILIILHLKLLGLDSGSLEALSINIISNILVLFATIFILDRLIKRHDISKNIKNKNEQYFNTLKSRHNLFVKKLERLLIHYVTKEPAAESFKTKEHIIALEELILNIEVYVDEKFLINKYNVLIQNPTSTILGDAIEKQVDYGEFFHYFKTEFLAELSNYTTRYLPIIPNELLNIIFSMEDLLLTNNAFIDPIESGIRINYSDVQFDPQFIRDAICELISLTMEIKYYKAK